MDEQRDRRPILIVAGLLIGGLVMVSSLSLGGRVPTVLSKVGAAIGDPTQRGGPIDPTGGGTAATDGGAAASSGSGTGGQVADAGTTIPSLLIVRTGQLELEVGDVTVGTAAADAAVLRAGGYISGSNRRVDVGDASATVAYRIPSATWQPTLDALHRLATQVRNEQVKTDEVSGQVVDLGARIANLRTPRRRSRRSWRRPPGSVTSSTSRSS